MAETTRGPVLGGGFGGQVLAKLVDGSNRTVWTDPSNLGLGTGGGREVLTANRAYFVNVNPPGSDTNDGLSAGAPFKTIQKALNAIGALDLNLKNVTVSVADGTYPEILVVRPLVGGVGSFSYETFSIDVTITGNVASPGSVIIDGSANPLSELGTIQANGAKGYSFDGFKVITKSPGICVGAFTGSFIQLGRMQFATLAGQAYIILANDGATVYAGNGAWDILGTNFGAAFYASRSIISGPSVVNLPNTPLFTDAFAMAQSFAQLNLNAMTFVGTATGKRYNSIQNSIILTNGGGPTYLPGDVAGTVATGGQYV